MPAEVSRKDTVEINDNNREGQEVLEIEIYLFLISTNTAALWFQIQKQKTTN